MKKYLRAFLIIMIIYPVIALLFDHFVFSKDQPFWRYLISGPIVGLLFIGILFFMDFIKSKRKGSLDIKKD